MYAMQSFLCLRLQPGKILSGLQGEDQAQAGSGTYAETALQCDPLEAKYTLYFATFRAGKYQGKVFIPLAL